jgi:hypothetical protein
MPAVEMVGVTKKHLQSIATFIFLSSLCGLIAYCLIPAAWRLFATAKPVLTVFSDCPEQEVVWKTQTCRDGHCEPSTEWYCGPHRPGAGTGDRCLHAVVSETQPWVDLSTVRRCCEQRDGGVASAAPPDGQSCNPGAVTSGQTVSFADPAPQ